MFTSLKRKFAKQELETVIPNAKCVTMEELGELNGIQPLEKITVRALLVRRRGEVLGWFYLQIKERFGQTVESYLNREEIECLKNGFEIDVISKRVTGYFDFNGKFKVC